MKVGLADVVVEVRVPVVDVVLVVVILVLLVVEEVVLVEEEVVVEVVPGGGGESSHNPKADWQPAPQYSGPEPHQKN